MLFDGEILHMNLLVKIFTVALTFADVEKKERGSQILDHGICKHSPYYTFVLNTFSSPLYET